MVQGHSELLAPMLVTKLGQHLLILGKPWMRKHGVIINMSYDKITFWPGHCKHSDIEKKIPTSEKGTGGIALAPKSSEPIRSQEKTLVQESGRMSGEIVSESFPKENFKKYFLVGTFPIQSLVCTNLRRG